MTELKHFRQMFIHTNPNKKDILKNVTPKDVG